MKKIALALLLAFTLFPAASIAQVAIRIGPPPPVVERRGPPPERGFMWIDGYHRWDGGTMHGCLEGGNGRLIRMHDGLRIAGSTGTGNGCWLRGTGGKRQFLQREMGWAMDTIGQPSTSSHALREHSGSSRRAPWE